MFSMTVGRGNDALRMCYAALRSFPNLVILILTGGPMGDTTILFLISYLNNYFFSTSLLHLIGLPSTRIIPKKAISHSSLVSLVTSNKSTNIHLEKRK